LHSTKRGGCNTIEKLRTIIKKRKTRRNYSSEEKIRIIIEGMCGETTIAELCRKEGRE